MNNCSICGKRFTCGCQKTYDDAGRPICKNSAACSNNPNNNTAGTRDLSLELAKQKIVDLKNG